MTVRRGGVRTIGPPEVRMSTRVAASFIALAITASCAAPERSASISSEPSPTPSVAMRVTTAPPLPGTMRFTILGAPSRATIRVREQIAGVAAPSDAILTTEAFSGELVLLPDGTFAGGSIIAAELDALTSDSDLRDEWIKINTLQTRRYPRAEFVPARVLDVPLPLPSSGEWMARLEGTMKIHGVERGVTWVVRITRSAGETRVRGSTSFRFADYGMAVPANRLILSVVDDVRLEIDVVARDT
jgi:polyisoprenoid-binding protein YceI